jgi:hypothetical protein
MKVSDLLKEDHRKVQELFRKFENADDDESKLEIARQALRELVIHATVEEDMVYPAVTEEIDDKEKVEEAYEEHHVAKFLISELAKMRPGSEHSDAKFKVLSEMVKHHIKEEESQILPKLDDDEMFAEQVIERKEELTKKMQSPRSLGASLNASIGKSPQAGADNPENGGIRAGIKNRQKAAVRSERKTSSRSGRSSSRAMAVRGAGKSH